MPLIHKITKIYSKVASFFYGFIFGSFYTKKKHLTETLQFLKKNISCNFVNKRHHGVLLKTPRGFVDILHPFSLKNLESPIVTTENIINLGNN